MTKLDSIFKSRDITLPTKVRLVKAMVFPVVRYGCESWTIKKAECQRTDAFEPWYWRRILSKGNQSWIFIGRTDAEAETPIVVVTWCEEPTHWKRPWCWQGWRQEVERPTEDEVVGWHHQLDGHEFEQALGVGDGQGSLACCSPWGRKESDTTEQLNWTDFE